MKGRREPVSCGVAFIRAMAVLVVGAAGVLGAEPSERPDEGARALARYAWGIAYYMSYDNDLDRFGSPILAGIEAGTKSDNVVAAVQADFSDANGMQRYVITSTGTRTTPVDSEDSADADHVIAYLRWFVSAYPCRKYIFTFLNHGGKVDEMCYDDHPQTDGKQWISGSVLGRQLRDFRAEGDLPIELLFLQQCGRGSIENLYSFRGTADYVMSSPVVVGAPNTYYAHLHRWLSHHPEATGDSVARQIAANDRDFTVFTCARSERFDELPAQLDDVIEMLLKSENLRRPDLPPVIYSRGREAFVDLRAYLRALAESNALGGAQVNAFCEWLEGEFFDAVYCAAAHERLKDSYCGLSLFVPGRAEDARRYGYLDLYRESRLPALWKVLVNDARLD